MKKNLLLLPICLLISLKIFAGEGAGHVGGTDQPLSSIEQVRASFYAVLRDIRKESNSEHPFNVILQEMHKEGRNEDANFFSSGLQPYEANVENAQERIDEIIEEIKLYDILDPRRIELSKELAEINQHLRTYLDTVFDNKKFYSDERFIFHDQNNCLQVNSEDNHLTRIARVTEFNINGKICISFEALRVIAPYDLKNHILGVLIHETAHLAGMNEEDAERVEALYHEFSYKIYRKDPMTSINFESQMAVLLSNGLDLLYWANEAIKENIKDNKWEDNTDIIQKVSTAYGMLNGFIHVLPRKGPFETFTVTFEQDVDLLYEKVNQLSGNIGYNMQFFYMDNNQEKIKISESIEAQMNSVIDIAIKCFPSHAWIFENKRVE